MTNTRARHSRMGIASFVLSLVPGVLLVGLYRLVLFLVSRAPPGADETGYGAGMIVLALLTTLSEIVALGLGIAGVVQRRRKRLFAFLGIACSVFFLAVINSWAGFVDLASFVAGAVETEPKVVGGNE